MDILSRNYFNVSNPEKLDEATNITLSKLIKSEFKLDRSIWLLLAFFGLLKFSIHLSGISNYGLHADELYYISLSEKFAWGFLDISPFVTWIAKASSTLFGSSIIAWRIIPCIFASATVMLTGLMAHYLGGKKLGITIACSAIICSPAFLATSYLLQPVVFDEFFWALLAFSILRYQQTQKRLFLYITALTLGFGMLNKYTISMYLAAILMGYFIVYTKNIKFNWRKLPGPLLLFILVIIPNLVWQWAYGFPIFGYLKLVGTQAFSFDVLDYVFQLFFFHGAGVAVWTAGFLFLLMNKNGSKFNLVWPITLVIIVILLAFLKGKLYYGLGMFPILFAAGGCCWEMILSSKKRPKFIFVATIYLFGLLCMPLVIPILPISICRQYIKKMVSYTAFSRPLVWEDGTSGTIPQFFADMSGWESLSGDINKVSGRNQNRKPIAVLTNSYAIAGALKYYSKLLAPQVISANNSFMLESPDNLPSGTILYLSRDAKEMVAKMARHTSLYKQLKLENSHLRGINIYILSDVNDVFRKKYTQDRRQFFHSEDLITPNKTSTLLSNLIGFKNR